MQLRLNNLAMNILSAVTLSVTCLSTFSVMAEDGGIVGEIINRPSSKSVNPANMLKVSYLQMDAGGSLSSITKSGYSASNMIYFAFADIKSDAPPFNPNYLSAMQTAINNETPGTINILSIGGQYATATTINKNTVQEIITKVSDQINVYNSKLTGGKISGVDLDLENEIDEGTITALAKGFKEKGLLVSVAPQVINLKETNVDPVNPKNLGLSSGGNNNQYGQVIAAGYIDYIMAQTYNSGEWTVGGVQENQVGFFSAIAEALNNAVNSRCDNATSLCIPNTVQIAIGEPSNAGASGTSNNIFGSTGTTAYNQAHILSQLSTQVATVLNKYPNIHGVMQWSLNNDYMPNGWSDKYAAAGAFSTAIFGATPPPALPYFILQVTNSGPDMAGPAAYSSATLVVNGQYWIFGTVAPWVDSGMVPIAPQKYQLWGTLPSSKNPATPGVVDSGNLDTIFSNSTTSFTTSQIIINGYPSYDSTILAPAGQWNCAPGAGYKFEAGHSYNVLVNAAYQSCDIKKVN